MNKKALSAFLAMSTIAGVATPAVGAFAEEKHSVEELIASAKGNKTLFHYNQAYAAIEADKENPEYTNRLAELAPVVEQIKGAKEMFKAIDEMVAIQTSKSLEAYAAIEAKIPTMNIDGVDKQYLAVELVKYTRPVIWDQQSDMTKVLDKVNEASKALKAGKVEDARKAIDEAKTILADEKNNIEKVNEDYLNKDSVAPVEAKVAESEAKATLKVESVTSDSLRTVEVKFTKPVDEKTVTKDTVKVFVNKDKETSVDELKLSDDNKTLTVSLKGTVSQSDELKVSINGVKDEKATEIKDFEKTVVVKDITAPVTKKVEVINNKKVKLHFSEAVNLDTGKIFKTTDAINCGADIKVDGKLTFAKFNSTNEEKAVEVEFFNGLEDGEHTIEVANVKDYANFKSEKVEFNFTTAKDKVAPKAVSAEVEGKKQVKVVFNEEVKNIKIASFKVAEAGAKDIAANAEFDSTDKTNKTVILTLEKELTAASIVGLDVKYQNVEDIFGNKNEKEVTISTKAQDDSVKPVVNSLEVLDKNELKVTFSEKVNVKPENFILYKEDGKTVVNAKATTFEDADTEKKDQKTYKVTFDGLKDTNTEAFKVKVTGVTDMSIRENKMEDITLDILAKDAKAPKVLSAVRLNGKDGETASNKLELVFSEAMNIEDLSNIANYIYDNNPLNNVTDAKIDSVSADGKKVILVIPGLEKVTDEKCIAMPSLRDKAGNVILEATIKKPVKIENKHSEFTDKAIKSVEAINKNTIVVTAEENYVFTQADANAFKFIFDKKIDDIDGLGVTAAQISADGKEVTLTTGVELNANGTIKNDATISLYINGTGVKDQNGTDLVINEGKAIKVVDKIEAAQVKFVAKDKNEPKNEITIKFNEIISGIEKTDINSSVKLTVGDTELLPGVDYTVGEVKDSDTLTITVNKKGIKDADVSVKINGNYFKDGNENGVITLDAQTVKGVTSTTELDIEKAEKALEDAKTEQANKVKALEDAKTKQGEKAKAVADAEKAKKAAETGDQAAKDKAEADLVKANGEKTEADKDVKDAEEARTAADEAVKAADTKLKELQATTK